MASHNPTAFVLLGTRWSYLLNIVDLYQNILQWITFKLSYPISYFCYEDPYNISAFSSQSVEPKDVDLEKALEYLSGKNVTVAGRKKKGPKLEAFDAM